MKDTTREIIFDLDGTLWDPCVACAEGWNNVVRRHAIPFREIVADDVRRVAGKPHDQCIRETFVGLNEKQLAILSHETMEEDNQVIAKKGGELYPGVDVGLKKLAERYKLFIVSNCQSGYIETFLDFTGYGPLFVDFECWGDTGRPKPDNLRDVLVRNGLKHSVFVGDAEGDRAAARARGIPFVFASYGFGRCTDFDARIDSFSQLLKLF